MSPEEVPRGPFWVLLLQRGLLKLGFATPVTGYYDGLTANAVLVWGERRVLGWHHSYSLEPA